MRGIKVKDFLEMPLVEKIFYHAAMAKELETEKVKLENIYKAMGAKVGS